MLIVIMYNIFHFYLLSRKSESEKMIDGKKRSKTRGGRERESLERERERDE